MALVGRVTALSILLSVSSLGLACGVSGQGTTVAERPYAIDVPSSYDGATAVPLVLLLHGFGASGQIQDEAFGFAQLAEDRGVLVAHPDGIMDRDGRRFWNATDACCDAYGTGVDDVAYLRAVIADAQARFHVDPRRVFVVGHSNGGYMAHRLACDAADLVAGIASLAGDPWRDPARCRPSAPVAVLQVHGDADGSVPYLGSTLLPSAEEAVAIWAANDGCTGGLVETGRRLDIDSSLPGDETRVAAWACPTGAAELWTIEGGGHLPALRIPAWGDDLLDWLLQHPKP